MNDTAQPETLIVDNDSNIDVQIEELEKIVSPAVNGYVRID